MPDIEVPDLVPHRRGVFICLEGGEGSGKTTMVHAVCRYLTQLGRVTREVADPGSTPLSQRVREIVIDGQIPCTPAQQALLYVTARDALAQEIRQYLEQGIDVVSGRWTLSTIVYQGVLGGVGIERVQWLTDQFINLEPDVYILLDATPELALTRKRIAVGSAAIDRDRFDGRPIEWHRAIRDAYYMQANEHGYPIINADKSIAEVQEAVLAVCQTSPVFQGIQHADAVVV